MRRVAVLCVIACLTMTACDRDPARSLKIGSQPTPSASPSTPKTETTTAVPGVEPKRPTDDMVHPAAARGTPIPPKTSGSSQASMWRPDGCPPPPMNDTGSDVLTVTGPCAFEHRAPAACESLADDFLLTMTRKGARESTVMIYINVEKYKGPGRYDGAQMFVGVQDKVNIYRWSSDAVNITVGKGEAFAVLPRTELTAEPLLVRCTGPMNNYQCEGREASTAIEGTVEIASGTIRCEKPGALRRWP